MPDELVAALITEIGALLADRNRRRALNVNHAPLGELRGVCVADFGDMPPRERHPDEAHHRAVIKALGERLFAAGVGLSGMQDAAHAAAAVHGNKALSITNSVWDGIGSWRA